METTGRDRKRYLLDRYARSLEDGEEPMTTFWLTELDVTLDECCWLAETVARTIRLGLMADAQMGR